MIELRLLGGIALTGGDGRPLGSILAQPKRVALLAYLAVARPRGFHRRDALLGIFWPESDEERGRAALSQAVYYLRRSLGEAVVESRGNEELRVDPKHLWCDVVAFETAVADDRPREALELFRGPLLSAFHLREAPGWERWVEAERARLTGLVAGVAWRGAEEALAAGSPEEGLRLATLAVDHAPYDEAGIRRLVGVAERVGGRGAAIQAWEAAVGRLERDLEVRASDETRALIDRLRGDEAAGPVEASPAPAPAREAVGPAPPPGGGGELQRPSPEPPRRRVVVPVAAAAVSVLAFLVVGLAVQANRGRDGPGEIPAGARSPARVAVLPFTGPTGDPEGALLAAGTADELRRRLTRLGDVVVIAGSSVARYRGTELGAREIGSELDAHTLVEGAVRQADGRIRVSVHLVDAASEGTTWSGDFEAGADDILFLQADVAERVAVAIGVRLRADERRRLATGGTEDADAFRLYLAGRQRLSTGGPAAVQEARDLFERAVAADSSFARAWAGLADAYDQLAGLNLLPSADAYARARASAEAALSNDPELAEAHASLAHILGTYFWDQELATRHFRRAIELDPSDARARRTYAGHLRKLGRYEEARREAAVALELAPRDFFSGVELGVVSLFEGRYDQAVTELRRVAGWGPGYAYANTFLARALGELGHDEEALAALEALGPMRSLPDPLSIAGYQHARAGRVGEARAVLAILEELVPGDQGFEFLRAVVLIGLGHYDQALDLLDRAADDRDWRMILIGGEPLFAPLRPDPRFQALLHRVGLTQPRIPETAY
jgi:TolB-like protein/DNA-binding SARP family transcriptional activator/Tfp pilus assembly protein PilF